ncbi:hypothetical protein D3C81_1496860 [compost metagenome]
MIGADEQHGQPRQSHQAVGDEVQWQGVDEQQHQATGGDEQHFSHDQLVQGVRTQRSEEPVSQHQAARRCQQQRQVRSRCLQCTPVRQPGSGDVQKQQQAEHQQALACRHPEAAARTGVGIAEKVVQDQHRDAAEQQSVDQRLALIGGGHDGRLQGDVGPQLMVGVKPQVDVEWLVALG